MWFFLNRCVALLALIAALPFLMILALAIYIEDKGPFLFSQERLGRDGNRFRCLKFRTMFVGADELLMKWKEANHPNWKRYVESNFKLQDDPRVTRIGRLLRRTSLDEVPQLLNVVLGEMTLVGPRPLLEREISDYGNVRFECYKRMIPGLTGLWQVSGRSDTTFERRAQLDCEYFEKRSPLFDIALIIKTVKVLTRRGGGAY